MILLEEPRFTVAGPLQLKVLSRPFLLSRGFVHSSRVSVTCWKGILDKVMPRRQKLQRGITLRSLIRMKDIEGRSMAAFLYWAAAEPRTLHLARIGGTAPTLIPPPRFALDVVKQFGIGGEIAEEAG